MEYMIESIGTVFSDKDLPKLANLFNKRAKEGYRFHSVFQVTQPGGCLNLGQQKITYLAIYVREE